jgi:hypothetical protein
MNQHAFASPRDAMSALRTHRQFASYVVSLLTIIMAAPMPAEELPTNLRVVLDSTTPVQHSRNGRLPLYVLPISGSLKGTGFQLAKDALQQLDRRAIGYSVDWQHAEFDESLRECLRIARIQRELGQPVAVNANACLYSFFDGSQDTLHVDELGSRFADTSLGGKLGCPFAIEHRVPIIKERVERFLRGYQQAGIVIDFIFADWEIDGPIEWNDAWATHKRCARCRSRISDIDSFRVFQSTLRSIRGKIQREAFGDNVTSFFPNCLVGNYGTYPHDGHRYWYDYFEKEPTDDIPVEIDQRAKYREWAHEFDETGYTFAMPVVYTWYPTFHWYDFEDTDYRWFYNMLKVGSNAGRNSPSNLPVIPFIHWHTTAPPKQADPAVRQLSHHGYQELLWHLLLRGHDTFFLWCLPNELEDEIKLVHQIYAESLQHNGFIQRGLPISFEVPKSPSSVVSGLRLGNRVLTRRTDFSHVMEKPMTLMLDDESTIQVEPKAGSQVVAVRHQNDVRTGHIKRGEEALFPIGFYEMPDDDAELRKLANAGVNLVRAGSKAALDRAQAVGVMGWMPLNLQDGPTEAFRDRVEEVVDHPALAVWEGPDEIVWTFTAYSFLKERAGFTRDDWNAQKRIAVEYSEKEAARIMPAMRKAVELVRKLDKKNRPVWINEAVDSDLRFARQYMPFIDITGADYYAVRATGTDLASIGRSVNRWQAIGQGKPVWMVLQGFSWHTIRPERDKLYPTFANSRFMAYDAIVHGAKGIFYWGTNTIDEPRFRTSLYALTSELAALQPFLTRERIKGVKAKLIHDLFGEPGIGVRSMLLRQANNFLLILVNEDQHHRLGVDIHGLDALNNRELHQLYGEEKVKVVGGNMVTRMQPFEVKLFSTHNSKYETQWREGREFAE